MSTKIEISEKETKFLKSLVHNLSTQNNRATNQPIFMVQEKTEHIVPEGYSDVSVYVERLSGDCGEYDSYEEAVNDLIESGYSKADRNGNIDQVWLAYTWDNVQPFFTESGAQDYIDRNKHNHKELRIYADSLYRNVEMQLLRNFLLGLKDKL